MNRFQPSARSFGTPAVPIAPSQLAGFNGLGVPTAVNLSALDLQLGAVLEDEIVGAGLYGGEIFEDEYLELGDAKKRLSRRAKRRRRRAVRSAKRSGRRKGSSADKTKARLLARLYVSTRQSRGIRTVSGFQRKLGKLIYAYRKKGKSWRNAFIISMRSAIRSDQDAALLKSGKLIPYMRIAAKKTGSARIKKFIGDMFGKARRKRRKTKRRKTIAARQPPPPPAPPSFQPSFPKPPPPPTPPPSAYVAKAQTRFENEDEEDYEEEGHEEEPLYTEEDSLLQDDEDDYDDDYDEDDLSGYGAARLTLSALDQFKPYIPWIAAAVGIGAILRYSGFGKSAPKRRRAPARSKKRSRSSSRRRK